MNIETLLPWSDPEPVTTNTGIRLLRQAEPNAAFWESWPSLKWKLRQQGITVEKVADQWLVKWWLDSGTNPVLQLPQKIEDLSNITINEFGLLDFQVPSVKRLIKALARRPFAIDASDTGSGKTYVAAVVARELGYKLGILCRKRNRKKFRTVAQDLGAEVLFSENYEWLKQFKTDWLGHSNTEARYPVWNLPKKTLLVFDEAHRCKNEGTINTKMMIAAIYQKIPTLAVSATLCESPLHMKAVGYGLGWHNVRDFKGWCARQGCFYIDYGPGKSGFEFNNDPLIIQKLHHEIFPEHGTRIRVSELGDKFPETLIISDAYEMDEAGTNKVYQEMQDRIEALKAKKKNAQAHVLAAITEARQRSELLKMPYFVEMAQDEVAEGNSVMIFVNYDNSADALQEKLKTDCCVRGGKWEKKSELNLARFQANEEPIIICNIAAGGESLDFHDIHHKRMRVSLISPSYSALELKQVLGRPRRAGGTKSIQKIIWTAGTIEEEMAKAVRQKLKNLDLLNDGDIGGQII